MFTGKTIFVTGGTGSWGHELVKQMIENHDPKEILAEFSTSNGKDPTI